ncbi:MAG: AMP-binding protein [Bifidobacteriaceae bacterium]|nr:AMP-binding protein [Bifidobacteriaceae bacterium]
MINPAINQALAAEYRGRGLWGDASLHDYWRLTVRSAPAREAVIDARGNRWTYAQVEARAAALAGHLRRAGVGAGDAVTVQLPNWAEFLVVDVACLKLGAVVNPALPQHRWTELTHRIDTCGSTALVMPDRFRSMDYGDLAARLADRPSTLRAVLVVENEGPADGRFTSFRQAIGHQPLPAEEWAPGRGSDVAAVLFTSGSEAKAKGVMLSHDNVLSSERAFAYDLNIGHADRMFMPGPVGHATGFLHGVTMPYMVGATSVLLDVFSGAAARDMIESERCTCAMGTTTVIRELFDACDESGARLSCLRKLCSGGAPVPRSLLRRALSFGIRLHSIYGSTESAPHTLTRPSDPEERVVATDGRAVTGTDIKVVDPATRATLPPGREGEEASRGPAVFLGYLGQPGLTEKVLDQDGWYYSGDLGVLDESGYLRITGRIKDVIVRGGENISAIEVEEIMREHPDVYNVAVVAMPSRRLGETGCAYVVQPPGAPPLELAELRAFFNSRGVAKYKIPERIEIVDALPMTPTGKIRKAELRARVAARLAAEGELAEGELVGEGAAGA